MKGYWSAELSMYLFISILSYLLPARCFQTASKVETTEEPSMPFTLMSLVLSASPTPAPARARALSESHYLTKIRLPLSPSPPGTAGVGSSAAATRLLPPPPSSAPKGNH